MWEANFSNVADVRKGFSSLTQHSLSQPGHKVLALDANPALTGFLLVPLFEPLSTLARVASRVETVAASSTD